jgi:hypothetical protein
MHLSASTIPKLSWSIFPKTEGVSYVLFASAIRGWKGSPKSHWIWTLLQHRCAKKACKEEMLSIWANCVMCNLGLERGSWASHLTIDSHINKSPWRDGCWLTLEALLSWRLQLHALGRRCRGPCLRPAMPIDAWLLCPAMAASAWLPRIVADTRVWVPLSPVATCQACS